MALTLKNKSELEKMRRAGQIVGECHVLLRDAVRPGVTTGHLNELVYQHIVSQGAVPSFLGYPGPTPFPASICASVDDQIVHGIPGKQVLHEGSIISIDIGAIWQGYHGDSAWTYAVGTISPEAQRLLDVTEQALYYSLEYAREGGRLSDISHAIQTYAEDRGCGVVRKYISHGIGRAMHEDPDIRNYGPAGRGVRLRAGMTFAIEPMLTLGGFDTRELDDGWTVVTADGSLAAHFEHTIAISAENGPEILTKQDH